MFKQLLAEFEKWMSENADKLKQISNSQLSISNENQNAKIRNLKLDISNSHQKVGRNNPCPCGSGKKYKKCHGA